MNQLKLFIVRERDKIKMIRDKIVRVRVIEMYNHLTSIY